MFCQTCGNKIPDDAVVCPHCGQAVSADDDMANLLSELSMALNEENITITEEATEAPGEYTAAAAAPAASLISDAMSTGNQVAAGESVPASEQPASAEPVRRPAAAQKPVRRDPSGPASATKKTAASSNVKKKKSSSSAGSKKKKKKKKKKSSGSAVLGVIIGLLVALLLIALAAGYMLFKLGFFDTIGASDEELLYNSAAEMPDTTDTTIMPSPSVEPAAAVDEAPAAGEAASAAEAEAEPEPALSEEPEPETEVTVFELNADQETEISLYSRGETSQIAYTIEPEDAESEIEWTSDDTSVATVSNSGLVDAKRGGTCTITGTCGDFTVTVSVKCVFSVPETVLDMNYEDITMNYEGQTVALKIESEELTLADENAISWESSDEAVATVDEAGNVTAVADGTAIISASYEDYTASCIIRCVNVTGTTGVNASDAPYVINYEDVTLSRKGEYFQLKLTAIDNSEDPDVTWVSDDKDVATVDSKGVVTAVSNGTCYVTATVDGFDFQCIVRVNIAG